MNEPASQQHTRFAAVRRHFEAVETAGGLPAGVYKFLLFGFKQGWACLFGGLMLALLLATDVFYPDHAPLARYDALTLAAVAIQAGMLLFRLESIEEAKVIVAFTSSAPRWSCSRRRWDRGPTPSRRCSASAAYHRDLGTHDDLVLGLADFAPDALPARPVPRRAVHLVRREPRHVQPRMVPLSKLGAWSLLIVISWVLVTLVHPVRRVTAGGFGRLPADAARPWCPES